MAQTVDPYYEWLGIPAKQQPPNHYRLLGLDLFEENREVIDAAANRQMGYVRTYQLAPETSELSQRILNELAAARLCLLNSAKKQAYDKQLRAELVKNQASEHDRASHPRPRDGDAVPPLIRPAPLAATTVQVPPSITTPPVAPPLAVRSERNAESHADDSDASMVPIATGLGVGCILLALLLLARFYPWSRPSSRSAAAVASSREPAGPPRP